MRTYAGLVAAAACAVGILAGETWQQPAVRWAIAMLFAAILAVLTGKLSYERISILCIVAVAFSWGGWRLQCAADDYEALPLYLAGHTLQMEGRIDEKKNTYDTPAGPMTRYVFELQRFTFAGSRSYRTGQGKLYLTMPAEPALAETSRIVLQGTVRELTYYRNDGMYDAVHRDRRQHILGRVFLDVPVGRPHGPMLLAGPQGWQSWTRSVREKLTAQYAAVMGTARAYMLSSLLFGGHYEDLPARVLESFCATGLIHILSVSGSHMSLLLSVVQICGRYMHLRPRYLFFWSGVLVLMYGALADFQGPVVRSIIMGLISAYSLVARRDYSGHHALALAILAMLSVSPYLAFDMSFRLSCGASAGIVLLQPSLRRLLSRWPGFLADNLAVCASAQILLVPYIFYCFHAFPLYTFLANMLVGPILDLVIILGLAASVLLGVLPLAGQGLLWIIAPLLTLAVHGNYGIAALPGSRYWSAAPTTVMALTYYAVLFLLFVRSLSWRQLLAVGGIALLLPLAWNAFHKADLTIYVYELGRDRAVCAVYRDGRVRLCYNKSRWANPLMIPTVLLPALHHRGIFSITEACVSGEQAQQTAQQLTSAMSVEHIRVLTQEMSTAGIVSLFRTDGIPFAVYGRITATKQLPDQTCLDLWQPDVHPEAVEIPAAVPAFIFHRDKGHDVVYHEWIEMAELLEIPWYSPDAGGEIIGRYEAGHWKFSYVEGVSR